MLLLASLWSQLFVEQQAEVGGNSESPGALAGHKQSKKIYIFKLYIWIYIYLKHNLLDKEEGVTRT